MLKRLISALLVLAICAATVPALAEQSANGRTSLAGASDAQRTNIALAAAAIDGTVVPYGGSFSFNATVGPRTKSYGFVSALNGRGVSVTGGGVAQAASTLYLALQALDSGIVFDDIYTYGSRFKGSYVSSGSDAILVDYTGGVDFGFTNYNDEMHIQMWLTDDYLYCALRFGTDEGSDASLSWSDDWSFGGDWIDTENAAADSGWNGQRSIISSAYIALGDDDGMRNNISLAAASINDTALPAGAVFSFNDIVGPREERCGYEAALNGRGSRVVGGGVAQVASVVWLAVKNLDCVAIVEKSTYGKRYNQSYVDSSSDAILTDYNAGTDFSFVNSGQSPLTVCTYVVNNLLCCDIYEN